MPKKESGMWRNKNAPMSKNYRRGGSTYMGGGMTPEEQSSIYRGGPSQPTTGMKKGGTFGNFKVPTLDGKPRRITKKTPQESRVRKKPGMATGGKLKDPIGSINNPGIVTLTKPKPKPKPKPQESRVRKKPGMFLGGKSKLKKFTGKKMTKSERQKFQKDGIPLRTLGKPYEGKVRKKPGMARGGMTINKRTLDKMTPKQLASDTMSEYFSSKVNESKGRKRGPGMARGGITNINKKLIDKMTPKQLKSKTMTDYFNSKVSESRKGRKKGPGR